MSQVDVTDEFHLRASRTLYNMSVQKLRNHKSADPHGDRRRVKALRLYLHVSPWGTEDYLSLDFP